MENFLMVIMCILLLVVALLLAVFIYKLKSLQTTNKHSSYDTHLSPVFEAARLQKTSDDINKLTGHVASLSTKVDAFMANSSRQMGVQAQISTDVQKMMHELSDTLVNKKARGSWGEAQLETLLSAYLGASGTIWQRQATLSNGKIVDIALFVPGVGKIIPVDSKFPLENFKRMMAYSADAKSDAYIGAERQFTADVKKHIFDIYEKYVTAPESIGQALMFVPNEAVYSQICSNTSDILDTAWSHHVLICSPTTLLGITSVLLNASREFEIKQNVDDIVFQFKAIGEDAERLGTRAQDLEKRFSLMEDEVHKVVVSAKKVADKIERLSRES